MRGVSIVSEGVEGVEGSSSMSEAVDEDIDLMGV